MGEDDRRRTAYHEGGHAVVGMLTPGADPVRKISIIPRGQALGVTFSAPDADRFNYQRDELEAKIKVALGGRAAEELVFGEPSTGAESDLQQLTQIARQMVGRWGMSDGDRTRLRAAGRRAAGRSCRASPRSRRTRTSSSTTRCTGSSRRLRGRAVRSCGRIAAGSTSLASALLEHETLDEGDAYAAAGLHKLPRVIIPAAESKPAA